MKMEDMLTGKCLRRTLILLFGLLGFCCLIVGVLILFDVEILATESPIYTYSVTDDHPELALLYIYREDRIKVFGSDERFFFASPAIQDTSMGNWACEGEDDHLTRIKFTHESVHPIIVCADQQAIDDFKTVANMELQSIAVGDEIAETDQRGLEPFFDVYDRSRATVHPDGHYYVSVNDGVQVWDAQTGLMVKSLGRSSRVEVLYSPDGALLALTRSTIDPFAPGRSTIYLYDAKTYDEIRHWEYEAAVYGIAWSPDSQLVVTASMDSTVRIWDVGSGEEKNSLLHEPARGSYPIIYDVEFSDDGRFILSASEEQVSVWNAVGEELVLTFSYRIGHKNPIRYVKATFGPHGHTVYATLNSRSISSRQLWNLPSFVWPKNAQASQ